MPGLNDPTDQRYAKAGYTWDPNSNSWVRGQPAPVTEAQKGGGEGIGANPNQPRPAPPPPPPNPQAPGTTTNVGNRDPFKGGDLFAQDVTYATGHDIDKGAFGPTAGMQALKDQAWQGILNPATREGFGTGLSERARGAQESSLQYLLDLAQGKVQSPAQLMMQQAADRNLSDAAALTASQRGLGASAAGSQVAGQRAQIGQELSRDMGILRLQEQMQATQAASRVAEGLRGQDIAQEQARAQIGIARDQLNTSMKERFLAMGMTAEQADRAAAMAMQELMMNQAIELGRINTGAYQFSEKMKRGDVDRAIGVTKDVIGAGGQIIAGAGELPAPKGK